jgi:hypothetical protein
MSLLEFLGEKPVYLGKKPGYLGKKPVYLGKKPVHGILTCVWFWPALHVPRLTLYKPSTGTCFQSSLC